VYIEMELEDKELTHLMEYTINLECTWIWNMLQN
jgi:hypothetical protein